jgi:glycosyltransferase involved in cell wall biosynthesis
MALKISAFSFCGNEVSYIGYSTMSLLPYVDEVIWADGNSNDGTLDLIKHIQTQYDPEKKVKLFEGFLFENYREDYDEKFNWLLKRCSGDWVIFNHADMVWLDPWKIRPLLEAIHEDDFIWGLRVNFRSFINDRWHCMEENDYTWPLIYKNAHGLHHRGAYGTPYEDFYFEDGLRHDIRSSRRDSEEIRIFHSSIWMHHYRSCKPEWQRLDKMVKQFKATFPEKSLEECTQLAKQHPYIDQRKLRTWSYNGPQPRVFEQYESEFSGFIKSLEIEKRGVLGLP